MIHAQLENHREHLQAFCAAPANIKLQASETRVPPLLIHNAKPVMRDPIPAPRVALFDIGGSQPCRSDLTLTLAVSRNLKIWV